MAVSLCGGVDEDDCKVMALAAAICNTWSNSESGSGASGTAAGGVLMAGTWDIGGVTMADAGVEMPGVVVVAAAVSGQLAVVACTPPPG